jgi:hypothetical protein
MKRRKLLVIGAAIASCPLALIVGAFLAYQIYMRFMFHDVSDPGPGDAFGAIFLAMLFGVSLLILTLLGWERLYRRISN